MKFVSKRATPTGRVALGFGVLMALMTAFLIFQIVYYGAYLHTNARSVVTESTMLAPFFAFSAFKLIRYWHRSLAYREDQCWHCGYSIVGNVSATCPECGTFVGKRPLN